MAPIPEDDWPGEELAREYLADPFGEPSPGLRTLLDRMRDEPPEGRLVLLQQAPARRWLLARLTGRRGEAPEIVDPAPFADLAEAARAIFRRRWRRLTGRDLP
ncbi:MAG: hypothetical protein EXQ95_15305 [Alphaproteobacteria bacterium]|nr:hypothetical protein [Alphaproteobacteria bacterium]